MADPLSVIVPVPALYADAVMPAGRVPITDSRSPACALVSTIVAETMLVLSTSVTTLPVAAIETGAAFSV